jgi:hypothetical protein
MQKIILTFFLYLSAILVPAQEKPRVFIFTDINIDSGDPDDRQSLVHLLWYANELEIEGIIPERWDARGLEACNMALGCYEKDYTDYHFKVHGYPTAKYLKQKIAKDTADVYPLFKKAAEKEDLPLYVLIWGNMLTFNEALYRNPKLAENIRIITIGTGRMLEKDYPFLPDSWPKEDAPCKQSNWNGFGRNKIFNDPQFNNLWWLEINWTYNGMFSGEQPIAMFHKLAKYGNMGQHIRDVVKNEPWAQYFRVGDTPSVLYIIDPFNDKDNPQQSSWAGKFNRPFPTYRPNYYTDFCGDLYWDYANPCNTWQIHEQVRDVAAKTLEDKRDEMYTALLDKLKQIYKID